VVCIHCGASRPDDLPYCPNCHRALNAREVYLDIDPCIGVHGWLAFLVFILVVLSPLSAVLALFRWASSGHIPAGWTESGGTIPAPVNFIVLLFLTAFGLYAGSELKKITPTAVRTAKRYFLAVGGYWSCVLFAALGARAMHVATGDEMWRGVGDFISGLLYVAIWYLYLVRSKRVAKTYPPLAARS
jgi:Protein of unknown function (DUF2569)